MKPCFQPLLAFLLLLASGGAVSAHAQTPVERHGRLRVDRNRLVDRHGRSVVLRGMSLFWSQWQGRYYRPEAIRWLRDDWNCSVVRAAMGVEQDGYLAEPERERAKVRAVVQAALDLGIYVIIDWHDHHADRHVGPAGEFFEAMAREFGDRPNVIFETWNEPLRQHDWSTVIKPYHETVIRRIRAVAPDSLIVCGTPTWSQDVDRAAADPLPFGNVAYTLHFYAGTHREALRRKASAALAAGAALMVTEWGTGSADGNGRLDTESTRAWVEFMERNSLSRCNWSVADKAETTAALRPGASPTGNWGTEDLSPSGQWVRAELRSHRPPPEPVPGAGAAP